MVDKFLAPFATHHRFISFMLYILGMPFDLCMLFSLMVSL